MAWNRPVENATRSSQTVKRSGISLKCGIAGLAILGIVVVGFFCRPSEPIPHSKESSRPVRSTSTTIASKAKQSKNTTTDTVASVRPAGPTNKVELTKNVEPPKVLDNPFYKCTSGGVPLFKRPIFKFDCENTIAGLLSAKPGERFLPVEYGADFDEEFKASLKEEILIKDDETPDDAAIKDAVKRAKAQIAEGMAKGLTPSEAVTSMRDEMNRVADYRERLEEDFLKLKEHGSAEDIEAYQKEANELLKEFGADPLDLPDDEVDEINTRLETEQAEGKSETDKPELSNLVIELPSKGVAK